MHPDSNRRDIGITGRHRWQRPDLGMCPPRGLALYMAFDEGLAERVRDLAGSKEGLSERKMFGGLCFLLDGNMSFGVVGSELMVRVARCLP